MTRRSLAIGFLIVLVFDTLAQVSFKLAGNIQPEASFAWLMHVVSTPWSYAAVVGYLGAFVTWMTILKHAPVGPAFAAAHLYVVTTAVISFLIFGEKFSMPQIVGSLLVIAGILILAYGGNGAAKSDRNA